MTKKISAGDDDSTCTTEATLAALATSVTEFVATGTLDSRLAGKLEKRLVKEAEKIHQSGAATKVGQKALDKALAGLAEALCQHDAGLLVRANAALRAQDSLTAKNGVN
jgi:hypothetical protein